MQLSSHNSRFSITFFIGVVHTWIKNIIFTVICCQYEFLTDLLTSNRETYLTAISVGIYLPSTNTGSECRRSFVWFGACRVFRTLRFELWRHDDRRFYVLRLCTSVMHSMSRRLRRRVAGCRRPVDDDDDNTRGVLYAGWLRGTSNRLCPSVFKKISVTRFTYTRSSWSSSLLLRLSS